MKAVLMFAWTSTIQMLVMFGSWVVNTLLPFMWGQIMKFGNWIIITAVPYLVTHWKGTWLAISVTGVIISILFGYSGNVISGWILSSILAGITFGNWWDDVLNGIGKAFSYVGTKIGYILAGNKGWDSALFLWTLISTGIAWGLFNLQGPNEVSGLLFGSAILSFMASVIIFLKTRVIK